MQAMLARPMTLGEDLSRISMTSSSMTGSCASPSRAEKDVAPFLKNLRTMLDVESDAVLRWTPNGRAFEIHDMDAMMASVLPKYFKHRKYTSFQRQLNYFNFRKWTKSKATVCTFSNDFFLRDQPELAWRITRKKSLHHSAPHPHSPLAQPKFPAKPRPSSSTTTTTASSSSNSRVLTVPAPRMTTLPSAQPWVKAESVAISVPSSRDMGGRAPFPSPTDQDMMLKEYDQSAAARRHLYPYQQQQQHQQSFSAQLAPQYPFASQPQPPPQAQQSPETLDWIDCLLPPVDRIEDELYTYMYQSSACAAVAAGSHAPKSSPYDFV